MKILEIRDGFIKFEVNGELALSSFIQITDNDECFIAQVVKVKRGGDYAIASAKILFSYNGNLYKYDNSPISRNAQVSEFSYEEIQNSIDIETPIKIGKFVDSSSYIKIDKKYFDKKTLIAIDSSDNINSLTTNLKNQLKNLIIIDTIGVLNSDKMTAGKDFKLPLNCNTLAFIYDECLNNATEESKHTIREIFKELADYSKTLPFLPFEALKTIVDEMVDKAHQFKLIVLKNELNKFHKLGYFASSIDEVENLKSILKAHKQIIDLSHLEQTFMNKYINTIYTLIQEMEDNPQVLIVASNKISKSNLKNMVTNENIFSTLIIDSKFKYINEIKSLFSNIIIEPSFNNNETFKNYSTFLSSMQKDTCLIAGEFTNYIPLVAYLNTIMDIEEQPDDKNEVEVVQEEAQTTIQIDDVEKDAEIIAIEKKSEDFIEKISIENEEGNNLTTIFEEETEEEIASQDNVQESSNDIVSDDTDTNNNESLTEELEVQRSFENEQDFHTEASETIAISVPDEVSELIENNEIQEEVSQDNENSYEYSVEDPVEVITEDNNNNVVVETVADELEENNEFANIVDDTVPETNVEFTDTTDNTVPEVNIEAADIIDLDDDNTVSSLSDVEAEIITEDKDIDEDDEIFNEIAIDDELEEQVEQLSDIEINDNNESQDENEELEKEIIEDVDKVFTTIKDDSISDSDLDFIDELNNDMDDSPIEPSDAQYEELIQAEDEETPIIESLEEANTTDINDSNEVLQTKDANSTIVPVYNAEIPAEDTVISDHIEQGDVVVHSKYGNGVVEKMIKYGSKTLYSINFENIGRRLLDPTLTELKKA